jgi:hypothetical protein
MRKTVLFCSAFLLVSTGAVAATKIVNGVEVRDWSAVDLNKDHYISPEEMQQFLQAQWDKRQGKQSQGQ